MTQQFDMDEQLAIGKVYEQEQDSILSNWFHIDQTSMEDDRTNGIDRFLYPHDVDSGVVVPFRIPVQYKGDNWINKTGNCSVEYLSNDSTVKLGGWLSTLAMWISVYDTVKCQCHILDAYRLRAHFGVWWCHRPVRFQGYCRKPCPQTFGGSTWNLLVPLSHMKSAYIGTVSEHGSTLGIDGGPFIG